MTAIAVISISFALAALLILIFSLVRVASDADDWMEAQIRKKTTPKEQ